MKEDRSLNLIKDSEFPGFLYVKIALLAFTPPDLPKEMNLQDVYA